MAKHLSVMHSSIKKQHAIDITPNLDGGILKTILREGEKFSKPCSGCKVSLHYVGRLTDGTVFDSSREENEPFEFKLGKGPIIGVFSIGTATMLKGEIASFLCQPQYAYGFAGNPPNVPPNASVIFEVEIMSWMDGFSAMKPSEKLTEALTLKERGTAYLKNKDYQSACELYNEMSRYVENTDGFSEKEKVSCIDLKKVMCLNLAFCYLKRNLNVEAIKNCNLVLELDPNNEKALFRRGQSYINEAQPEEAMKNFSSMLKIAPGNSVALQSIQKCKDMLKKRNPERELYAKMFANVSKDTQSAETKPLSTISQSTDPMVKLNDKLIKFGISCTKNVTTPNQPLCFIDQESMAKFLDTMSCDLLISNSERSVKPLKCDKCTNKVKHGYEVMVKNLPPTMYEDDVLSLLWQFGNIHSLSLKLDPMNELSKGIAFVNFVNKNSVQKAIEGQTKEIFVKNGIKVIDIGKMDQKTAIKKFGNISKAECYHECTTSNYTKQCSCVVDVIRLLDVMLKYVAESENKISSEEFDDAFEFCTVIAILHSNVIESIDTDVNILSKMLQAQEYANSLDWSKIKLEDLNELNSKINVENSSKRLRECEVHMQYSCNRKFPTPNPKTLPVLMKNFITNEIPKILSLGTHPAVVGITIFCKLLQIHPWSEGNGRTARMLLSSYLISNGYTAVNIPCCSLYRYMDSLRYAQKSGDFTYLYRVIIEYIICSMAVLLYKIDPDNSFFSSQLYQTMCPEGINGIFNTKQIR